MDDAHTFTEDQVMKELHRSLKASLKDAKAKGLLGNDDLTGEETQLVIYGLALFLYSAAVEVKSASPVMLLPWSQSEDKRQTPLDATTCPPQFLPFFNRWVAVVPCIRSLPEDHSLDLARIICKKTPVTLPAELPDPFPFSPTPEVKILATLHGISADLRTIALGIYDHRSFQAQYTEDVREELMTSIEDIEEAIGVNMPASEILTRLARHGYQDISDDLDLAACMERPSGRAPNGDTYSGRLHDGTKITIKTIPVQAVIQDDRKRSRLRHMARELHAWSKCQHPNITRLLGLAEFKGQIAALSLSMDNGNLLAYVQKTPDANRLDLATQVAAGLAYLHFIGVVHCDLKGANVLVSNDGTATLINISGVVVQDLISDPKTTMEGFSLSPRWMAPEMLEGRSASAEADVYALGMTILETMSGAVPYAGEVDRHVISATLWGRLPPRPIKNIPSDVEWGNRLWSMLLKCWVRDPQRRLTAGEVYDTMRGIAQFCYKSKAIFVPGTHAQILGTTISSVMSPSEIVAQLGCRGCPDMSDLLDLSSCSNHPISRGGFGDVYRGKLRNGIQVALKTMVVMAGTSHEEEKQLKHTALELYTWAQCEHQNVVKLLGLATFRDQITMLSPWMDNGDLRTYISKNPQADRTILCAQTARGLAYLHNKGIVHGDVKGANVLVSNEGVAMLTDFGNAVLKTATLQFTSTTTKNHISVRWTAPEMLEGGGYTTQADIYALGMTILETISGRVPYYDKQHDHAVMHSVMIMKQLPKRPEDHIPSNSSDGNILWSLLLRCWSYERTGRPNAGDVFKMMKTITRKGLLPRT